MVANSTKKRNLKDKDTNDEDLKKDIKPIVDENPSKKMKTEDINDELISKKIKTEDDNAGETEGIKTEDEDDISDVEYGDLQLSEYEKKRMENVRDNAKFIASIGFHKAKFELDLARRLKSNPSQTPKRVYHPRQKSARIQRLDPTGVPLPPIVVEEPVEVNGRKLPKDLKMGEILSKGADKERHSQFANNLQFLCSRYKPRKKETSSKTLKKFLQDFSKVEITEERVRKVVESRIYSVVVHPTEDKVLVGAGGKQGSVGLWDANQGLAEDAAIMYYPHTKPVSCLEFSPHEPEKLFSCSYDGTLRCGHFEKKLFENVYYTPVDHLFLRNFVFLSPHVLLVAQSDGNIAFIDRGTDGYKAEKLFRASPKDVRTVDLHPTKKDYFLTASLNCELCLWDMRKMKNIQKKICSVSSDRKINSGYFSPITGNYILTTSRDDSIRIYDSSKLTSQLPVVHSIRQTKQVCWLERFQASWHPSRDDLFVCGSKERPRRIDLFSTEGYRVRSLQHSELLNSVQSLNRFHPSLNVLVGANLYGRLHVFMDKHK